jgi:hypothetical protein
MEELPTIWAKAWFSSTITKTWSATGRPVGTGVGDGLGAGPSVAVTPPPPQPIKNEETANTRTNEKPNVTFEPMHPSLIRTPPKLDAGELLDVV